VATLPASEMSQPATMEDTCPWCGQPIAHEKFIEIKARIRANERARTRDLERRLRDEQDAVLAQVQAAAELQIKKANRLFEAQAADARRKADAAIKAANKQVQSLVRAARDEERKKSRAAVAAASAETARLRAEADQRLAEQRAHDDDVLKARLREQRDALDKVTVEAINAEKAKAFTDRQKLEARLAQLQRQVAHNAAAELGEGAELNLYEQLRDEFPGDTIVSVKRGQPGADLVHTVIENGRECGHIVYDSKSRAAWRNSYVSRLLDDKIAAKADHAVLVTRVFPAGQAQLYVQDGVIVANPARVLALAQMIRKHVVQQATLRLSDEARAENTMRLYDFITSDRCSVLLEQIGTVSDKLLDLDVKEHRAHTATWKQRGQLIREIQQARGTLVTEIDLVLTTPAGQSEEAT
jgi:hypothetical protein